MIQLLPSLIAPSRLIEFGKKKFKPTIKDSREALIISVNVSLGTFALACHVVRLTLQSYNADIFFTER